MSATHFIMLSVLLENSSLTPVSIKSHFHHAYSACDLNSRSFYGIITSGNRKGGFNIYLDDMTADHKKVCSKRRNMFSLVDHDEE